MTYLLGLDISTTGAKALIINEKGEVVASHTTPQPISTPKPQWSEQNPSDWWEGIAASIRAALEAANLRGDDIACVGLTGQMHGLVLQDAAGEVLRPAILWNDQRTGPQCDEINQIVGEKRLVELTGNRVLAGFTATKIMWVRENEPDVYARGAHFLLPKDYIRYKLTGEYAMDLGDASGTLVLDIRNRRWLPELLDKFEIPEAWLPKLYEGTDITGQVHAQAAEATGLKVGTPVVGGGGDQQAGAVGVGAVKPGIISLVVGTSGVVFTSIDHYAYEPEGRIHIMCHSVPGLWDFMGVTLAAAGSLQWFYNTLAANESFDDLLAPAGEVQPGSEGLVFLPYLSGERHPYPDPYARGAFIGLTVRHTRAHMTRAVLEGVAFSLKDCVKLMEDAGVRDYEVRISGGGSKSPLWRQIIADVLGAPLVSTSTTEGAAYGAALMAAVGAGVFPDVATACDQTIQTGDRTEPSAAVGAYEHPYEVYRSLYPTLRETFTRL
jgi:xylulokinase